MMCQMFENDLSLCASSHQTNKIKRGVGINTQSAGLWAVTLVAAFPFKHNAKCKEQCILIAHLLNA